MTKLLVTAAALGLTMSAADACEYMRSVQTTVDQTVVASIADEQGQQMSVPEQQLLLPPADSTAPAEPVSE